MPAPRQRDTGRRPIGNGSRRLREQVRLPVVANGDIWSVTDYTICRAMTGCADVMIGRGLIACPDLALQIHAHNGGRTYSRHALVAVAPLAAGLYQQMLDDGAEAKQAAGRLKQWLTYLRMTYAKQTSCSTGSSATPRPRSVLLPVSPADGAHSGLNRARKCALRRRFRSPHLPYCRRLPARPAVRGALLAQQHIHAVVGTVVRRRSLNCTRRRVSGAMVVSRSCSGFISPRPLNRVVWILPFFFSAARRSRRPCFSCSSRA